jgi:hypothetical protein
MTISSFVRKLRPKQFHKIGSRLQRTLEVLGEQQRERDSRHNINRDMVVLVVLVVMIQGSILQNSISAVNFLGSIFILNI